jgi:RNA 3'-terminal phosphate cyclase (ATP)
VAAGVVSAAQQYLAADVTAGIYLADQILLPLALAGGGVCSTLAPSQHTTTNLHVIRQFLAIEMVLKQLDSQVWLLCVGRDV